MAVPKREIIYIDIEDEITSVIDKVSSAKSTIIALVPPKRAPILQSIVNMKLLKRRADQAGKKLVLVTSESGLLPLAAMSQIHVAKNLQSKPEIPKLSSDVPAETDIKETESTVGELSKSIESDEDDEEPVPDDVAIDDEPVAPQSKESKKDKKAKNLKIPNFDTFRKKLLLGGGAFVLLIFAWFVMFKMLPKGSVTVKAETSRISVSGPISALATAKSDTIEKGELQSEIKTIQKTLTQDFTSTGEKNTGSKAAGSITIRNCDYPDGFTLAAGSKFTDSLGKTFSSTGAAAVPAFTGAASSCNLGGGNSGKVDVAVEAVESGDSYNLGARGYTITGVSGKVDAQGGQMSGGTTKIVKIVSEADVTTAKQKILSQDTDPIKDELKKQFDDSAVAVDASFASNQGDATVAPNVGDPGDNGKVTMVVNYSMVGVRKESLRNYIQELASKQYDASKQKVYDDGVKNATIKVDKKVNDQSYTLSLSTDIYVGPQIDENEVAKLVSGKRVGEAEEYIRKLAGVRDVKVTLSPFYIKKLPKPSKINVSFDVQATNQEQ